MNILNTFYSFFYKEKSIDKKLNTRRKEYRKLGLKSDSINNLEDSINVINNKAKRIKTKLDLKYEYILAINHHNELDVW